KCVNHLFAGHWAGLTHKRMQLAHFRKSPAITFAGTRFYGFILAYQIMCFNVRYIGGKLILRRAVRALFTADKNNSESDFRQAADNLVNPGRYPAPDIRISTLKQQGDIRHGATHSLAAHCGHTCPLPLPVWVTCPTMPSPGPVPV